MPSCLETASGLSYRPTMTTNANDLDDLNSDKWTSWHCSLCSQPGEVTPENEGYSECCNKGLCDGVFDGWPGYRWKVGPATLLHTDQRLDAPNRTVDACCYAAAKKDIGPDEAIYCRAN